jgi:hypothetical protein
LKALGRLEEGVRTAMLAADIMAILGERDRALAHLMSTSEEERQTPDAAEVLGDAALRAEGWHEALELTEAAPRSITIKRIRACALAEVGNFPERQQAIRELDDLVDGGGNEGLLAALFRVGLVVDERQTPWSDDAAELLRREEFEEPAVQARAWMLQQRQRDSAGAVELLAPFEGQIWALLTKLRLASMRKDRSEMTSAANALLDRRPAQDVVVEAAHAITLTGDSERGRRLLLSVAHDQTCPPVSRANAYALLMLVLADARDWDAAHGLHTEWTELRPTDTRAHPWAPMIAARRARP